MPIGLGIGLNISMRGGLGGAGFAYTLANDSLVWTSGVNVAVPVLEITIPSDVPSGYKIRGQSSANSDMSSPIETISAVIAAGDLTDLQIDDFTFTALSDGLKYIQVWITDGDDVQASNKSNIVSKTLVAEGFDPASLFVTYSDGFWLDANLGTCTDFVGTGQAGVTPSTTDAATILSWNDQSGKGRHWSVAGGGATRKNSIINSLPVVRFIGSGLGGASLAGFGSAAEIFAIIKVVDDPALADETSGIWKLGTGQAEHYPYSDGVIYAGAFSDTRKTAGDPTPSLSSSFRLLNVWSAANDWSLLIDGTSLHATGTNTVAFNTAPTIGTSTIAATVNFIGDIAEIICVNAKVTTEERTSIKAYFATKYGLTIA